MAWILPTKRPIYRRFISDKFEFSAKNGRLLPQPTRLPARVVHNRFFHRFFGSFRFFDEKSPIKPIFCRFFWQSNFPRVFLFEAHRKTIFRRFFDRFFRLFCPWLRLGTGLTGWDLGDPGVFLRHYTID